MPARKPAGIEMTAGLRSGKIGAAWCSRSTQIVGLRTISATERVAPVAIAATAPAVLKRRQTIESRSGGKLALAATAKARPTMKATFWPLKRMPENHRKHAEGDRREPGDTDLLRLGRPRPCGRRG